LNWCKTVARGGSKDGEKEVSNGERLNSALIVGALEGMRELVRLLDGLYVNAGSGTFAGEDDGGAEAAVEVGKRERLFTCGE
jgi:hypothetical protein